ncbi:histone-lysine N-methyltransferase, H3 lysine-9 specific SUVH4 isoform X1 [Ziziphus jujuba]|uniref:Histone-lysine N-methyltransferase, H3 lysine-9 specific SUVH4 isoform X1 n=2 Tax=Ziziphus jujuba TaxID=326968 RepID=A0A6P4B5Y3_ZIZJJ|nr:histone-lysine N-methyltransferase, H3 lysine-9 specific SUVH4 isoform X1 [Ziziphus jujuba]
MVVVPSPKCKGGTQSSIPTATELTAQMDSPDPHLPHSHSHSQNSSSSPRVKIKYRKRSAAEAEQTPPTPPPPPPEENEMMSSRRRFSARIKAKERVEKELLVRRRVELLGADHEEENGGRIRKRAGIRNSSSSAGNRDKQQLVEPKILGLEKEKEMPEQNKPRTNATSEGQQISKPKSDHAKVKETLRLFNKYYLQCVQEEEKRCRREEADKKAAKGPKSKKGALFEATKHKAKRPDLKAISKMLEARETLYPEKRFGNIPGIDVGHQFYSRAEMVVVGFHSHWLNGIDYMGMSYSKGEYSNYTFPLAVSIVLSGMYEDDLDNADNIVYTGQGGQNLTGNKRQIRDQKLERGNLALKNCLEQCVPVRVVRGHESASSYCGKVYTYDGLYKVVQYWAEKGISGFTVFKYRLKRLEGQPVLTTNQVQFIYGRVPQTISEIRGLVCEDITGGLEDVPIPATNLVDDPPVAPTGYTYCKYIKVAKNVKLPPNAIGCNCKGSCVDPKTCSCAMLNGSDFPYVHRDGGRLIEAKDVVFECGPSCGCGPSCVNRTSQRVLKYRLEVFRTPAKGWAVRSWDFIPSGAPVCEYIGILRRTEDVDAISGNDYIFDIDCLQTMKGLGGREKRSRDVSILAINSLDKPDDQRSESVPEFCIDAGSVGNVARFINHSCGPNLFVQCVLSSHHDIKLARIMLFAADNIPPLQELTYDYGYALDSVLSPDGKVRKMPCYCGAADCRKRLF